ncbi:SDR family oxidoreductase [Citreicella sp. C3M06]|uniref:SDR family NAD(P)-dependent oxidoreductase n=1 Tax=Citreicella sp. C3M06 TaxID=2841564 RepID=UPI001C081E9D|nr:SDR family NAD(P)-dependent oxidoreductase [Citreicella sp. C3M06]MBU2962781.1 SDR family oxidoreductase [Citreicella sp. C3M06]
MRIDLSGQVFAVTGAAQGIGAAICRQLVASGARVAALDIDGGGMAGLDGMSHHVADLGSRDGAHAALVEVAAQYGHIDGLVCSAGGVRGQVGRPIDEITDPDWHAIFAANVDAAMWCAQAVAPGMKARGAGRIVTITSGAGLRPSLTGIQAYAAAKHALVGLTRQLALELGPEGITVNSVAPGFVLSNPSTEKQWAAFGPEKQQHVLNGIHARRLGKPDDIATAVCFLVSAQAGWISGQVLSVDGGHA